MLTKRKGTRVLIFIGILILIITVWQVYKYRIINNKAGKEVAKKTKGLYSIRYEGLSLDEISGTLHLQNIEITPDTAVYNRMVQEKTNPSILIKATIPVLNILGVKTPKALLHRQVEGRSIEIANPSIEIMLSHFNKDTTVHDPSRDISKDLLARILKISIDSVKIIHGNVVVRNMQENEAIFKSNDITCLFSGLLIDSTTIKDSSRILFSQYVNASCDDIQLPSKNRKYKLYIGQVKYTSLGDILSIGRLKLTPRLSETEFAASFPVSKDRYDFSLEDIRLLHISRNSLWHKRIKADSLVIGRSSFKVYRDLNRPPDTASKVRKNPQQQLMRLPLPLTIRKVVFTRSFIEYKERSAKSDSTGKLQFFDVAATISNVTNWREVISRNNKCTLLFRGKLLDRCPIDARLVMLLHDQKGRFSIQGSLGAIDAVSLTPVMQPMALARMEKGRIDSLHFDFTGNDSTCEGPLTMFYRDIKISLLKKDKTEDKFNKKGLATLAANLVMKHSNPKKGESPRTVNVHFNRITNKSFFNLIWKSIFSGIKETAGMK